MSEKRKKFELDKNLYALDSSGTAPNGAQMKRQADATFKEVVENFDADAIKPLAPKKAAVG